MTAPLLTDHQLRILELVAAGHTHAEIADELVLTHKGLTAAVNRVLAKLSARNAPHAVLLACRAGLLDGKPRRHGDHAGFAAHVYRGEDPWACTEGCPEGERAYRAERRRARREAKAAAA
ncbi:response regulator transcription factor [Streptomyces wuyuanensis]|uniref:Regulatory protein, luxR family n=1 Tax=Streptomyces wuyuanensis TaxID=1196353 RepID=A0A1G9ZBY8_9ACTN|nr:helix-turn-helix transcriptional regulator [Streptomyces wuyuanensis]SDN18431.1 regulatory protein, luxR family [Streptomyces wuyuanensis]